MLGVAAHIRATSDSQELRDLLVQLGETARGEPGTLQWALFQTDELNFTITEIFADQAAYQTHEDNPETLRLSGLLAPFLAGVDVHVGSVLAAKQ